MIRSTGRWSVFVLLGTAALAWFVLYGQAKDPLQAGPTVAAAAPQRAAPKAPETGRQPLVGKLYEPVTFPGIDDAKTTLQEALSRLTDLYDVSFEVNEEAFQAQQANDILSVPVAEKPIAPLNRASLDKVVRKVLSRLPVPATYMVRRDVIEITTVAQQRAEVWGPDFRGPFLPLVNATIEKRPLNKALQDLSERTGFSVVLDVRAADKAQVPVSAAMTNLPLDSAVRTLADMAGLKTTLSDNVLYVTAQALPAKLRPDPNDNQPAFAPGLMCAGVGALGGGVGGGGVAGGVAGVGGAGLGGGALGALGAGGGFGGGLGCNGGLALYLPAKQAKFDKRSVTDAIKEVIDGTHLKLVVDDKRVGNQAGSTVMVDMEGATVETVIRVLADLADLRPVFLDNVVYLTTKANAKELQALEDERIDKLRGFVTGASPPPKK